MKSLGEQVLTIYIQHIAETIKADEYRTLCSVSKVIKKLCYFISTNSPFLVTKVTPGVIKARFNIFLNCIKGLKLSSQLPIQRIKCLSLHNTNVSDITALSGLIGLHTIGLGGTQVSDITPLSGLIGLHTLNLRGTEVSDVTPLSGLIGLHTLN